jgi:hypothetical protein
MQQSASAKNGNRADRTMKRYISITSVIGLMLFAVAFYAYQRWGNDPTADRAPLLSAMPSDASAIVFADFAELRTSPFTAKLYAWAPQPTIDADYAQFVRATGFVYERDLDRVAIAAIKRNQTTEFFAIAGGRFDRTKITAYALQSGTREMRAGREVFSVPLISPPPNSASTAAHPQKISFTFLRKDRIALTNSADLVALLSQPQAGQDAKDWQERFARLAGSPLFAVIRQDAAAGSTLATRAPGGWQSPQLAPLLDQLQWITIAGKPEGDSLRVVTEGECTADSASRQLADLLGGVLLLAQAGLNGPQIRQQLDPQAREAYLEMLKSADVSRIDRGDTKSVRLVFDVTPKFLQAARTAVPAIVPSAPATPPSHSARTKKSPRN